MSDAAAPGTDEVQLELPLDTTDAMTLRVTPDAPDAADDTTEESTRDEQGRFKKPVQPRIDELTREKYEANRLREAAEAEAAYWRKRALPEDPPPAPVVETEPELDDFPDYGSYIKALTKWEAKQVATATLTEARRAEAESRQAAEIQAAWQQRTEQARTTAPDFDETLRTSQVPLSDHLTQLLRSSEVGPRLAYQMAKDPSIADRLNQLPPMVAAKEFARLEDKVARTDTPPDDSTQARAAPEPRPRVSGAPPPVRPVAAATSRSTSLNLETASMDDYVATRVKQGAVWRR
jgi:hypothetical protein